MSFRVTSLKLRGWLAIIPDKTGDIIRIHDSDGMGFELKSLFPEFEGKYVKVTIELAEPNRPKIVTVPSQWRSE